MSYQWGDLGPSNFYESSHRGGETLYRVIFRESNAEIANFAIGNARVECAVFFFSFYSFFFICPPSSVFYFFGFVLLMSLYPLVPVTYFFAYSFWPIAASHSDKLKGKLVICNRMPL